MESHGYYHCSMTFPPYADTRRAWYCGAQRIVAVTHAPPLFDRVVEPPNVFEVPASCVVGAVVSPGVAQSGSPYGKGGMVGRFV
eukprot:scaffold1912_cov167-Amphora_coffeaeformis.AAC.39